MADKKIKKPEAQKATQKPMPTKNIPCGECGKGVLPRKMRFHLNGHRLVAANRAKKADE